MAAVAPVMTAAAPYMAAASLVTSFASAREQVRAGKAQQQLYSQQASDAIMKGRFEALRYKNMGVDVLKNLNETLAASLARGAIGGDPASGSSVVVNTNSIAEASREKATAADNAIFAVGQAESQAEQYRMAGGLALRQSKVQAASTVATGLFTFGQLV